MTYHHHHDEGTVVGHREFGSGGHGFDRDPNSIIMAIFFSTGDLGDVGRHVVEAALAMPVEVLGEIRVFSKNIEKLNEANWSCGCPNKHGLLCPDDDIPMHIQRQRLVLRKIDVCKDSLTPHLAGVDVIISCLGNRNPFNSDFAAKLGTANILKSMTSLPIQHILMLSSVGISEDWPPLEWSLDEGKRLQGHFRTIGWMQYQDLSAAEMLLTNFLRESSNSLTNPTRNIRSLVVRAVLLNETDKPTGEWCVQQRKHHDHPTSHLAKMDCARFLVQEAIQPTIIERAVVVGGAISVSRKDRSSGSKPASDEGSGVRRGNKDEQKTNK